jgi:hypothetical protein
LDSEQRIAASKVIKRFIMHAKKTAFIVEHDFIMATYLADRFFSFYSVLLVYYYYFLKLICIFFIYILLFYYFLCLKNKTKNKLVIIKLFFFNFIFCFKSNIK